MIVRVKFEGTVGHPKAKESHLTDHVDIHAQNIDSAKEIFIQWINTGMGLRGASGVFHPLLNNGCIKTKEVKEVK